jgi:hypothetical protein
MTKREAWRQAFRQLWQAIWFAHGGRIVLGAIGLAIVALIVLSYHCI